MTAAIQRFRPRALELDAIELSDGRYLVLADPPRYCPKAEWEAAFELIAPAPTGKRPRKAKGAAKRAARKSGTRGLQTPGRAAPAVGKRRSPLDAQHERALALAKDGKSLQEIAGAVGVKYSAVWNWSQKPDWPKAA